MKKIKNISFALLAGAITLMAGSCKDKRSTGSIYMPDMAYSRTFETYSELDSLKFTSDIHNKGGNKIFFNEMPPAGTIKRGELFPYTLPNDSNGYKMSAAVPNPVDFMTGAQMSEAGRLYNINCGVCHGEKGQANGPLAAKVGGIANLTLDIYKAMSDGTMFHSLTYGKNNMGSYASQLSREQRWMIVKYVRTLQGVGGSATAGSDSTGATKAADSTSVVKK